ncbi:hypothetical protein BCR43DRAFT_520618 [Syncephalastrum racemosum]|uniref:DRBM domain-containing protein n=1 Tax=Syncephalastrum racemosum TaxID=13706 RepID=A0A1X2HV85_SYNRA|nr:hypothetical protein BCR43DRAFT_520618 [Syncephalastrum racemosum]
MLTGEASEITLWINSVFGPFLPLDDAALTEFHATFAPSLQQAIHTKTYTFLGPVALQYAAALYAAERYQRLGVETLNNVKSMLDRGLLKFMTSTLNVPSVGDPNQAETILSACIGVTHALHGIDAVQRLVAGFIDEHKFVLFRTLPKRVKERLNIPIKNRIVATPRRKSSTQINTDMSIDSSLYSPLQLLHEMISNKGGSFKWHSSDRLVLGQQEWGERIVFKLSAQAQPLCHERYGLSKRKAKMLTATDIANYYKSHPGQLELDCRPVDAPGEPQALPIPQDTYSTDAAPPPELIESKDSLSISSSSSSSGGNPPDDLNRIHIAEKRCYGIDDASVEERLMDILLNFDHKCEVDAGSATKRRKASDDEDMDTWNAPMPTRVLSDLEVVRKHLDMSRVERMYKDPVQYANPKSSFFSYIYNLPGLETHTTYTESGPPHQRVFEASTTISAPADQVKITAVGEASRKSEAEMVAIREMIKLLLDI